MATKLVISVSGKGGTGKTTVTALLLKWLIQNSEKISLVVDADPATNLPDVLGIKIQRTVGQSSRELKDNIENGTLSPMLSKKDIICADVLSSPNSVINDTGTSNLPSETAVLSIAPPGLAITLSIVLRIISNSDSPSVYTIV